jgi:hypothetical protein
MAHVGPDLAELNALLSFLGSDTSMTRNAYKLCYADVDQYDKAVLASMLQHANQFLQADWTEVSSPPCDMLFCGSGAQPDASSARIIVRLIDDASDRGSANELPRPIRLMRVLEVLANAEAVLEKSGSARPVLATPSAAPTQTPTPTSSSSTSGEGWLALAQAIRASRSSSQPGVFKVTIDNNGPVWIDLRSNTYSSPFPIGEVGTGNNAVRFEAIAVGSDATSPVGGRGQNVEQFLWIAGLKAVNGESAPWVTPGARFRLKYWPNLAKLPHTLSQMGMAARLASGTMSVEDVARACKTEVAQAQNLINALSLMGLLNEETQRAPVRIQAAQSPPPIPRVSAADAQRASGLLGRLRNKFRM